MIHVSQHIPGYVSGVERAQADVDSLEQLLALPWVASWARDPLFVRFSKSTGPADTVRMYLMAETGNTRWVVAYLSEDPPWLDLPLTIYR